MRLGEISGLATFFLRALSSLGSMARKKPLSFWLHAEEGRLGTASKADHKEKDSKMQEVEAMHHQLTRLNP